MLLPELCFGLHSLPCPAPHQGNYWGFYHFEKGLFLPWMHMLPLWITLGAKGNVSVRVLGEGPCPQGPSRAGRSWSWGCGGAESPHSSRGSPGICSAAAPKNARPKAWAALANFNSRGVWVFQNRRKEGEYSLGQEKHPFPTTAWHWKGN